MDNQNENGTVNTICYCVGEPSGRENGLPGISSIDQFLPETVTQVNVFHTEGKAFDFMWNKKTERDGRYSYNATFCVMIPLTEAERNDMANEKAVIVVRNRMTILSAELQRYNPTTNKYEMTESMGFCRHMVTQSGILFSLSQFIENSVLGDDQEEYKDIKAKINEIFTHLNTPSLTKQSKYLLQSLETHTLLLIESILNQRPNILAKPKKSKILSELDTIKKGLELSIGVLTKPDQDNVKDLQTFVEKEAHGRTKYWKIWGGILLAIAASGLFALGIILAGTPAIGAVGGLAVTYIAAGTLSIFGRQTGVAKIMNIITDKATENMAQQQSGDTDTVTPTHENNEGVKTTENTSDTDTPTSTHGNNEGVKTTKNTSDDVHDETDPKAPASPKITGGPS